LAQNLNDLREDETRFGREQLRSTVFFRHSTPKTTRWTVRFQPAFLPLSGRRREDFAGQATASRGIRLSKSAPVLGQLQNIRKSAGRARKGRWGIVNSGWKYFIPAWPAALRRRFLPGLRKERDGGLTARRVACSQGDQRL